MNESILVVEDDAGISRLLLLDLQHEGYEVTCIADGQEGLDAALKKNFSLIILDVMLPTLNGIEVLTRLREVKSTPVIILTARGEVVDKVSGLDLGADDYMTKPFNSAELLARIRANLRKSAVTSVMRYGRLTVEQESRRVLLDGQDIELTKKEFDLLTYLLQNRNKVCTREKIMDAVWGYAYYGNSNPVDVHIRYLRRKIEVPYDFEFIKTVRSGGYTIRDN